MVRSIISKNKGDKMTVFEILKQNDEHGLIDAIYNRGLASPLQIKRCVELVNDSGIDDLMSLDDIGDVIMADYRKVLFSKGEI